jgi:hypothetical protein
VVGLDPRQEPVRQPVPSLSLTATESTKPEYPSSPVAPSAFAIGFVLKAHFEEQAIVSRPIPADHELQLQGDLIYIV